LAQLDAQAAVVADDSTDSAAAQTNTTATQQEAEPKDVSLEEMYGEDRPQDAPEAGEDGAGEGEERQEGEEGAEEGEQQDDLPPVNAPSSWKAEEKELFSSLPRNVQETIARREAERDQFVNRKSEEATKAARQAEVQALRQLDEQIIPLYEQRLQAMLPQVPPKPSYQLQADDPYAFAEQMDAHERALAQHSYVQQQVHFLRQQQEQVQQTLSAQEAQETHAVLSEQFPEYLDPDQGPKLREELGSIALEVGYSPDVLANANAMDILAMRKVSHWKAKADRWDALQKDKMANVRKAKTLPKIARPGTAGGGAQPKNVPIEKVLYPND